MSAVPTPSPIRVIHLTESSGGIEFMFGKERVIHWLMRAQAESGLVSPALAVFSPTLLAQECRRDGFDVTVLGDRERTLPLSSIAALRSLIDAQDGPVLHTHGYKANIIGRILRVTGARLARLVATCHGFVDTSASLRAYNALDRATAFVSDIVGAPDAGMLRRFPRSARTTFIPNALPDSAGPAPSRDGARAQFGFAPAEFVAGMLGRFSVEKGTANFAQAARSCVDRCIVWAAAGNGPLEHLLSASDVPALRCVGYRSPADDYLAAIDVYVQPSFTEGLSLSLLEAMRAGLPIVATDVGATSSAVRHEREALLVRPDPAAIVAAVVRLKGDPDLRERLGDAARARFVADFRIDAMQRRYYSYYVQRSPFA
jgi:glycosyltransferase involved in cell wall biosynthesis